MQQRHRPVRIRYRFGPSAVAEQAYVEGSARLPRPDDLRAHIVAQIYDPFY